MSPVTIRAAEQPLEKIFSDDYVFCIPKYQRPYSWTTEQAGELLDDLLPYIQDSSSVEILDPYFLGSIVLIKGDSPSSEVVDGQQRLTTLTIMLAVLRSSVPKSMSDHFTGFLYEKGNPLRGTADRYRLTLRDRDVVFFQDFIQKENGLERLKSINDKLSDSQTNIRNNALYLWNRVQNIPESDRLKLAQYLATRCFLVVVQTPDFDSAYRIFSVLNDRGLDLTHSDILKAEIIGRLPQSVQEIYTKKWEDIEDELGRDAFKDLFAHIRMIYRKRKLEKTVLQEFREHVNPTLKPQSFIDDTLIPFAEAMQDIRNASYESASRAEEINGLLRWLGYIDNFDWLPPAIIFLANHRQEPDVLVKFFTDLERLAMGLFILRSNINERIDRYARLLTAIENGDDLHSLSSPLQLTPTECKNIVNNLNGNLYLITKIRMPILLRLDSALSSGGATYNYSILTVEHVLPQNPEPTSKWCQWFHSETSRENVVHRLGNLVLLTRRKNSQARNFDFDRKKKEYFSRNGVSPFALTTQVLQEKEWTPEVLDRRQSTLIETLKELWRL